jgi:hypothetical protein
MNADLNVAITPVFIVRHVSTSPLPWQRKKSVRMLDRILTETDASVESVYLQYRECRTWYRSICPRLITQEPVPRYEPVRIEEIRYRSRETRTGNGIPDMYP